MRSGSLRHRIVIQESIEVSDGMGSFTTIWSDKLEAWVAIWPFTAREILDAMKLGLKVSHKIRMRYQSGITAKNRIKFGIRIFNIVSLINFEERNIKIDFVTLEDV